MQHNEPRDTSTPAVAVHLVIHNGAAWLRDILDPLMAQTYQNMHIYLLDNASTDGTGDIVRSGYPDITYVRREENLGIWARQEELLAMHSAPYVLVLTDVMMEPRFIERGVAAMEAEPSAGAAQAKILRADRRPNGTLIRTNIIDTVGFTIARTLHVSNLGHGEEDSGQYDGLDEVFGVEGAAPLFRRTALEHCRVEDRLIDPDYEVGGIGYGDDVDLAWRMRLFGFSHIFVPDMIGWHDRSTTKRKAGSAVWGRLARVRERQAIPLAKRRLDWSNVRFTIIKNVHAATALRNAPRILVRELALAGYTLMFEPGVFKEALRFVRLLPAMLRRRRSVMRRAAVSAREMNRWLT